MSNNYIYSDKDKYCFRKIYSTVPVLIIAAIITKDDEAFQIKTEYDKAEIIWQSIGTNHILGSKITKAYENTSTG